MMGSAVNHTGRVGRVFLPMLFLLASISSAQTPPVQQTTQGKGDQANMGDFTYTSQRRDPFERSLGFKTKGQLGEQPMKSGYELEELKLVGVLKAGPDKYAVMEDTQGKGLLFKKGANLNKNMWVSEILEEQVILGQRLKGDTRMISLNIPRK